MLVSKGGAVVVLSDADIAWDRFRNAILADLGGGRCSVGVGGWCDHPRRLPTLTS